MVLLSNPLLIARVVKQLTSGLGARKWSTPCSPQFTN